MGWWDEDSRFDEWEKIMDSTTDKTERLVLSHIREKFPEYEPIKTIDQGDVIIYYLRYHGEVNNFGSRDLVMYYNTWYPGEFNLSRLEPVFE